MDPKRIGEMSVAEVAAWIARKEVLSPDEIAALAEDNRQGIADLLVKYEARAKRQSLEAERLRALWSHEESVRKLGYKVIAGVDEVGRGPLAGPVVAAAVVLPFGEGIPGLNDSKRLTEKARDRLFDEIAARALGIGVGMASSREIDETDIRAASFLAMTRALESLACGFDFVLVDGFKIPGLKWPQAGIVKGDAQSASIAAASVVAKVTRDRLMEDLDREYPGYGFARHKGYPTSDHVDALRRLGPCEIHRRSFRTVAELFEPASGQRSLF